MEINVFNDAVQFEAWLASHHKLQSGMWLKIAKKGSGIASVTIVEALDVALCYGWIDGQRKSYDETYYLQKFTPRRPKSLWSKVNIAKVEALIADSRMQAPGLAAIISAKEDGRWDAAYESQKNATVPPDLAAALEHNQQAKDCFEALNKTNQYAIILPIITAKTPKNRVARLQKVVTMLAEGEKLP
ncbi:MAG: YdeI/OmpD-associated family protein [Ktedonobacteraceae bacterium]